MTDSSADCIAHWKKGDGKILLITHTKEKYVAGQLKSSFDFKHEAHISILDSTISGYTIQWINHLPEKVKRTDPALAESLIIFEGLKMIFTISETGSFIKLVNWEEVRDTYVRMMELSLPKSLDSATQAAVNASKQMFSTREMVESALIREIQLFHAPYGGTYTTNEKKIASELPNPFSGDPFPALQTTKITQLSHEKDYFKLSIRLEIDKIATDKLLENILKKMNVDSKAATEVGEALSSMEITDQSEYEFQESTGWLKVLNFMRRVKAKEIVQTDSYVIEMKN
jgi:hypothetical protein